MVLQLFDDDKTDSGPKGVVPLISYLRSRQPCTSAKFQQVPDTWQAFSLPVKMSPLSTALSLLLWTCSAVASSSNCCYTSSAWLTRRLEKDGFHRDLVTSVQLPWSPSLADCRLLLVERLPAGVYADPYQLARLPSAQHKVLGLVDVEAMAHDSTWLDVLSWVEVNVTEGEVSGQVTATVSLPVHARYHRADETERIASVYIESPRLFLGCDWENQPDTQPSIEAESPTVDSDDCKCDEKEPFPCRIASDAVCEYHAVQTDNSPTVVLPVPLGDLRDLELVLVGTAVAVTAGTVLLLLVINNKTLESPARHR
ncbi:phosphatidylinositol-glycan biosynthesis class X protein-like isoform X2 [Amphibalanus amphitrite]|nr:phosphatidylinositol-glycan biosynthesis class X protein-like isoform X2 [Amphibalanus amphitrite]XP_043209063.1 phosphatidylinositol-glycan biosynthesis class X protein-like isoform X2 [Amphibalanus amphitrite]